MAIAKGLQQVMSSPNAPILTKGDVSPFTQNVPVNITTDSDNDFIREDKNVSIGDELLSTIRQIEQLPIAQSFFNSKPSTSASLRGTDDDHDTLTQVMGRTSYSDPRTKKRKFPCVKKKITLLKPPVKPALVEPDTEPSAPIKSEPDPAPSAPIKSEPTQEMTVKEEPPWYMNANKFAPPRTQLLRMDNTVKLCGMFRIDLPSVIPWIESASAPTWSHS